MQSTVTDGADSAHDRTATPMEKDHNFARESLEGVPEDIRWQEERPLYHFTHVVIPGIKTHTAEARHLRRAWLGEFLWIIIATIMCSREVSNDCVLTDSLMLECRYCGTITFLMWLLPLIVLWFYNLFTYVLFVSRGVHFSIRSPQRIINRFDVPEGSEAGGMLFALLSTIMFFWVIAGIGPLVSSNKCYRGLNLQHKVQVSSVMWWTSILTILFYFPLFYFGRQKERMHPLAYFSYNIPLMFFFAIDPKNTLPKYILRSTGD